MELYFIRHGQSINNANWERDHFQAHHDPKLTEIGRLQVKHLARFLGDNQARDQTEVGNGQNQHGFGFTHIYTSLMVRAVHTAAPVATTVGLPLMTWSEIHETGGIYSRIPEEDQKGLPGQPRSYFETHFPDMILPDWLNENGWWNRPLETRETRKRRAKIVWKELLKRHADRKDRAEHRVALVSHGGFFMYLLTTALGIELRKIDDSYHEYWFRMNNCAISRLDIDDRQVVVSYINRNDFIPGHLIT